MASKMRQTMEWLGLAAETQQYEGYDDSYDSAARTQSYGHEDDYGYPVDTAPEHTAQVTQLHKNGPASAASYNHAEQPMSRITTIHPRTYNEAKDIGESFRDGVPVIMNLSDMDDTDAKRLVDFAAGLVFGLHGTIERVTSKVFLLSPAGVEVSTSAADGAAAQQRGLFNQS